MKITKLETIHLADFPHILFVAVHTDAGLVGYSDTFYMPEAVRGYLHNFAAPFLLGRDPLAIELIWQQLYKISAHIVGRGLSCAAFPPSTWPCGISSARRPASRSGNS